MVKVKNLRKQISDLKAYRAIWTDDIDEGWSFSTPTFQNFLFNLYEISGSIILALQQVSQGRYHDKRAMLLVQRKFQSLTKSEGFEFHLELCAKRFMHLIYTGANHPIYIMSDCLKALTA